MIIRELMMPPGSIPPVAFITMIFTAAIAMNKPATSTHMTYINIASYLKKYHTNLDFDQNTY